MSEKILAGKIGVVMGVANKNSIAWGIAKAWAEAGAKLVFSVQAERFAAKIQKLVDTLNIDADIYICDVTSDDQIDDFFKKIASKHPKIDLLLHSLAFAPREALEGDYLSTTRSAFNTALEISAYSLVAVTQRAEKLMSSGGSIIAMTYLGSERVVPRYNVMGVAKAALESSTRYLAYDLGEKAIRINAISAGPMQTLAARGISGFGEMFKYYQNRAPLKRSCTLEELGACAVFLASDGAASISGQTIYVDGGYSIMGM